MRKTLNQLLQSALFAIAIVCVASVALAQQQPAPDPNAPDPNDPNNPDPQVHVVGQGGNGAIMVVGAGGMQGRFRLGGPPMMMGGALEQFIGILGQINLKTDFTLTADQKNKIQAIRDDFKQQHETWRTQHADELKQLDEQQEELFAGLQQGNPPDPAQMMELEEARRQLHETAPNGEDHVAQIKALFTPEQTKVFDERAAQIEKDRDAMFQGMPGGRFMRRVGMPPTPPTPPADPNAPQDEKKGK